jgi:hypothetical protein
MLGWGMSSRAKGRSIVENKDCYTLQRNFMNGTTVDLTLVVTLPRHGV